jgi:hypothetical protein
LIAALFESSILQLSEVMDDPRDPLVRAIHEIDHRRYDHELEVPRYRAARTFDDLCSTTGTSSTFVKLFVF